MRVKTHPSYPQTRKQAPAPQKSRGVIERPLNTRRNIRLITVGTPVSPRHRLLYIRDAWSLPPKSAAAGDLSLFLAPLSPLRLARSPQSAVCSPSAPAFFSSQVVRVDRAEGQVWRVAWYPYVCDIVERITWDVLRPVLVSWRSNAKSSPGNGKRYSSRFIHFTTFFNCRRRPFLIIECIITVILLQSRCASCLTTYEYSSLIDDALSASCCV